MQVDTAAGVRRTFRAIRLSVDLVDPQQRTVEWEIQEWPLSPRVQNDSDGAQAATEPTIDEENDAPLVEDDPYNHEAPQGDMQGDAL